MDAYLYINHKVLCTEISVKHLKVILVFRGLTLHVGVLTPGVVVLHAVSRAWGGAAWSPFLYLSPSWCALGFRSSAAGYW